MVRRKTSRADQARFFAIGQENDEIVAQRRPGAHGADHFENRTHTGAVVGRARTFRHGIEVRHQHDRAAIVRPTQGRDNVVDPARLHQTRAGDQATGSFDPHLQAELAQLRDQISADLGVRLRPEGMRAVRDVPQMRHGPRGREFLRRRSQTDRGRQTGLVNSENHPQTEDEPQHDAEDSVWVLHAKVR